MSDELAPRPSLQDWPPHGLVSLWDIMRHFRGDLFGALCALHSWRMMWESASIRGGNIVQSQTMEPAAFENYRKYALTMQKAFADSGMVTFEDASRALLSEIDKAPVVSGVRMFDGQNLAGIIWNLRILTDYLSLSMRDRQMFLLQEGSSKFFDTDSKPFGSEVHDKFQSSAGDEIIEAGKCLAFQRGTACVFHLMRTLDIALDSIRQCLQLPKPLKDQQKNWGTVLGNIKKEIDDRKNPQHARQWQLVTDEQLFVDVHASLVAIKDAWRNKTMHVEKSYTPEQAEQIWVLTKGFMQRVASRLDEDGSPVA